MQESYIEIGTVPGLPAEISIEIKKFARELGKNPHIAKRVGLAGPNDIFDIVMSADLWAPMLPWAQKVLGGAAGYIGGYAASTVLKSRVERKLDKRMDALEIRFSQAQEELAAKLGKQMDQIIEHLKKSRTPWGNPWELRIGLKGGLDDADRAAIVSQVNFPCDQGNDHSDGTQSPTIKRKEVARAVLATALLGPTIESYMDEYRASHGKDVRFLGKFSTSDNGVITAKIQSTTTGEHTISDEWTIQITIHPDGKLKIIENKTEY